MGTVLLFYNEGMNHSANAYCSFCGTPFTPDALWPRVCPGCGNITYRNPLPVCVVLVPIQDSDRRGVLAVRRAIPPRLGELALPGGFINYGETWQEAGAREVFEETGLTLDPAEIRECRVSSAPDNTLIIFGLAHPRASASLPPFNPNNESSERIVLDRPVRLAFSLHTHMVEWFFSQPQWINHYYG